MQAIEALQTHLRKIAAGVSGQVANVRMVMGRQHIFSKNTSGIFMLPYRESTPIQNLDPADPDFGTFYFMADIDTIDGSAIIQ